MAEVYHFNECNVRTVSGTTETIVDSYAENVSVNRRLSKFNIETEDGLTIARKASGEDVDISIGVLFAQEFNHTDGNALRFYFSNVAGSVCYQAGSAYVLEKGISQGEDAPVKYDIKLGAASFGTV